jgi:transposase
MRKEVLVRYAAGDSTRVVAEAVGVSKTTVLTIVKQAGVSRPWGVRK